VVENCIEKAWQDLRFAFITISKKKLEIDYQHASRLVLSITLQDFNTEY